MKITISNQTLHKTNIKNDHKKTRQHQFETRTAQKRNFIAASNNNPVIKRQKQVSLTIQSAISHPIVHTNLPEPTDSMAHPFPSHKKSQKEKT